MSTVVSQSVAAAHAPAGSRPWLHRYAIALACCTFGLLLVGSTVTTTGSGLAVPDWPTTYGQNMFTFPPSKWVGGIFYEHGHRLVASGVGLMTMVLCAWLWCARRPRWLRWVGTSALAVVCLQGALGGLTVLYRLPTAISVAHAGLAQVFFCLTLIIAAATAPAWVWWRAANAEDARRLWRWGLVAAACIYAQILAGALVRHTQSGLAITDFPLSYGRLLPPVSEAEVAAVNAQRTSWDQPAELLPVTQAQLWIHFGHRVGAAVVGLALLVLAVLVFRHFADDWRLVHLVLLLIMLVAAQVVLGALTIWTQRSLAVTTAHVGCGALMWAAAVLVLLVAAQYRGTIVAPANTLRRSP